MEVIFVRKILFILSTVLLILLTAAQPISAEKNSSRIRVGYYENGAFQTGANPGDIRRGYAYEYYRKISEYTGWRYEYVYGTLDPAEGERLAGLLGREVSGVYRFLMLLETNEEFFGRMGLEFGEKLRTFISVPFRYLNLNPQQSVLFFEKGDTEGLAGIAERI
ncbi:MAG: hypothetical protein IIU21_04465, partial [Schwartzia sp.]|nr:hypothetical protein [Schwartzia sp. (in: firmicutes)]